MDRKPDGDRDCLHDSGNRNLFWDGDTRLTYPRYGKERAVELFEKLKSLSDFVIVDCMSNPNESLLSLAALETASQTVRLCTPELPSISWYRTQKAVWGSAFPWADMNQGLNLTDNGNLPHPPRPHFVPRVLSVKIAAGHGRPDFAAEWK